MVQGINTKIQIKTMVQGINSKVQMKKKHQGLNEQLTRFKISMVQRINKSFSDKIHSSGGILQLVKILWLGC